MKKLFTLSLVALLSGCASSGPAPEVVPGAQPSPTVTAPMATLTPSTPAAPQAAAMPADLSSAQQACTTLKSQFQTQLPFQVLNLMTWQTTTARDPLQPNSTVLPACVIAMNTTGETILRQGLTPNFMSGTLGRLDWMPGPVNYLADSPTGHQEAMIYANQVAVVNYQFMPPANACPKNQAIAACKFSKKKWLYQLKATILVMPTSSAVAPLQTS